MTGIETVEAMERAVGLGDWDLAAEYLAPDLVYRCAGLPARQGVQGLRDHMAAQGKLVRWEGHETHLAWEKDGIVVIEVTSFFHRQEDGARISVPCTDIYRFDEKGRIADWGVYADISVFRADARQDVLS
ncbi:nuclear transport factor 2 family protein [Aestuariibius sp. 2305UL40-4]|uniref:nuclear transport factor 2 family protein n=1 Tax=Aestuariibius violaceus TaxID=3234132 RepID=UPI00345EE0A0